MAKSIVVPGDRLKAEVLTKSGKPFAEKDTLGDLIIDTLDATQPGQRKMKVRKIYGIQTAAARGEPLVFDESDWKDFKEAMENSPLRPFAMGQLLELLDECEKNGEAADSKDPGRGAGTAEKP